MKARAQKSINPALKAMRLPEIIPKTGLAILAFFGLQPINKAEPSTDSESEPKVTAKFPSVPATEASGQETRHAGQGWTRPPTLSAQPGIECPCCQCRIEILIPVLLSGMPIRCPSCSLELKVDREKSADSLAALEKLHGNFAKASEMMDKATKGS